MLLRLGTIALLMSGTAAAADFDVGALHSNFTKAFNARQWDTFRPLLADDVVFHRANAAEVYSGPDAVMGHFTETIGAPDQWNVKFAMLNSDSSFAGKDGRVVERGDFAVTAGADGASCYRGSYMMTWAPQSDDSWKLQLLAWQDIETEIANCQ